MKHFLNFIKIYSKLKYSFAQNKITKLKNITETKLAFYLDFLLILFVFFFSSSFLNIIRFPLDTLLDILTLFPHFQITAKGRTNIELREQFILADGVSQTMTAFKPKTSASSPASGSSASSLRTPQGPITKVLHQVQH